MTTPKRWILSFVFSVLRMYFVSFHTRKQVFIAPPSIALKTRELDDARVNNYNPTFLETAVYGVFYNIESTPDNSNLQGKLKELRVIDGKII